MLSRLRDKWRVWRGWRLIRDTGVWRYEENAHTMDRFAYRYGRGYEPCDRAWVEDVPPRSRWTIVNDYHGGHYAG